MNLNELNPETCGPSIQPRRLSLSERLKAEKSELEDRIKNLDTVIKALENNSNLQFVLDELSKLHLHL